MAQKDRPTGHRIKMKHYAGNTQLHTYGLVTANSESRMKY